MPLVKISSLYYDWPWKRQTPGESLQWGDYTFSFDPSLKEADYWVIYDDLNHIESTKCKPSNTLVVLSECQDVKVYPKGFTDQFRNVLTYRTDIDHPGIVRGQAAYPWWVGMSYSPELKRLAYDNYTLTYDNLKANRPVEKTKLISVISSSKTLAAGHVARLEFVTKLREIMPDVDVFGKGIVPFDDKWEVLSPYRFHIVIENAFYKDYFSEKLADAFLAECYPLYHGCPNVSDYFPNNAVTAIDIKQPDKAVEIIKQAIDGEYDKKHAQAVQDAKDKILDTYNMFPTLEKILSSLPKSEERAKTLTFKPIYFYGPVMTGVLKGAKRLVKYGQL